MGNGGTTDDRARHAPSVPAPAVPHSPSPIPHPPGVAADLLAELAATRREVVLLRAEIVRVGGSMAGAALPAPPRPDEARSRAVSVARATVLIRFAPIVGLYALALALLAVRIGAYPNFAHNWESYTAAGVFAFGDAPSLAAFGLNEGLMTESGDALLVVLPIWTAFALGGVGLTAMRIALALITAAAVPLLWLVGRSLVGGPVAAFGALLLALSPVYLLYGRTATIVGISLVPALATTYALLRVLRNPGSVRWLVVLQALLVACSFAYAPIRVLWPLSLVLLGGELLWRKGHRLHLTCGLLLTALVLPGALVLAGTDNEHGVTTVVRRYYNGRGEQILRMREESEGFAAHVRPTPEEEATGGPRGNRRALFVRLLRQNAGDYLRLHLDRGTSPTWIDHWNVRGRLYAGGLVPFFLIGLVRCVARARRHWEDRTLLACFFGFGLPIVFTTKVHVGRLIFALPFLLLIVASGSWWLAGWIAARFDARRDGHSGARFRHSWPILAGLALLTMAAWSTWIELRVGLAPTSEHRTAVAFDRMTTVIAAHGGAALILHADQEVDDASIHAAAIRLELDDRYRFIGPTMEGAPKTAGDNRPLVSYGGVLERLPTPGAIPNACSNLYFVAPSRLAAFVDLRRSRRACPTPIDYEILPE